MTTPHPIGLQRLMDEAPFVRMLARTLLAEEVDEVVQQTWLQAIQHGGGGIESPRAWLSRVVRNVAANLRRGRRRRQLREDAVAVADLVPSSAELMQQEEQRRHLVAAVDRLPEDLRAVVLLRYFDGLQPRQIAARLGVPVHTVWNQLRRALQLLRERLDAEHGSRRAWLLPLIPFAAGRPGAPWVGPTTATLSTSGLGALVMTTKVKLAAAFAVAVALAGAMFLQLGAAPDLPEAPSDQGPGAAAAAIAAANPRTERPDQPARTSIPTATAPASGTASLIVRARYADDTPATDLTILVADAALARRTDGHRQRTDAGGTARFAELTPGQYRVCSRTEVGDAVQLHAGETLELDYRLPLGLSVRGIVVDARDVPVAGARIEATLLATHAIDLEPVATTDASGRFVARDLSPAVFVSARAEGHGPSRQHFLFGQPGNDAEVRLQLGGAAGAVDGLVVDEDGQPIADAVVRVGSGLTSGLSDTSAAGADPAPALEHSDEQGRFRAFAVPPGKQPVMVRAAGFAPWSGTCEVLADATAQLRVQLAPGATIAGVVRDAAGKPVADAEVTVGGFGSFGFCSARTEVSGNYQLDGLPAGEILVLARHPSAGEAEATLTVAAGSLRAWNPQLGHGVTLAGTIVDDAGAPIASAVIEARSNEADHRGWRAVAHSDAAGAFQVANCPSTGTVHLQIAGTGIARVSLAAVDPADGPITVRCARPEPPSATIRGVLVGADGAPQANVLVDARRLENDEFTNAVATGPDGAFELTPLTPGSWRVAARRTGSASWHSDALVLRAEATIDLGRIAMPVGGSVQVRVAGDRSGIELALVDALGLRAGALTEADGGLRCGPLAAGDYRLLVTGKDTAAQGLPVRIRDGETTPVDVAAIAGTEQAMAFEVRTDPLPDAADVRIQRGDELVFLQGIPLFANRPTPRTYRLVPGTYQVQVLDGTRAMATASFTVGATPGPTLRLVLQ